MQCHYGICELWRILEFDNIIKSFHLTALRPTLLLNSNFMHIKYKENNKQLGNALKIGLKQALTIELHIIVLNVWNRQYTV